MFGQHTEQRTSRFTRPRIASFGLNRVLLAWGIVGVAAMSFGAEQHPLDQEQTNETLERIRTLILPQQKQWARNLIRQQPDTPLAKLAQQLLDEYKMYDAAREAEQRKADARTKQVREFWKARYRPAPKSETKPLRITNQSDEPVLFQVKGPSMAWSNPQRLRSGETQKFHYPVIYRRFTKAGTSTYSLSVGTLYVFKRSQKQGVPKLFRSHQSQ